MTLAGEVLEPLARPVAPVIVQQQLSCTRSVTIEKIHPGAGGHFSVTFSAPASEQAASYRLTTEVPSVPGSKKLFATFSLPEAVQLK